MLGGSTENRSAVLFMSYEKEWDLKRKVNGRPEAPGHELQPIADLAMGLPTLPRSPENPLAEFDGFATNYKELLSDSVRITGESSDYFAAYKAAYIATRVGLPPNGQLLDYGCGVGLLSRHLKNCLTEVQIDGFDVSQDSVNRVEESLLRQGTFTSNLNCLGRAYDLIVLSNVLHHVRPHERHRLIGDAALRLADGGKLVIFEHNPINPLTRWAVSQCPFDEDAVLLPLRETCDYFRNDELRPLSRDYIVFFPRWLRWFRQMEPYLRWCPLGAQYAVVAGRVL
jgi:SAM-dependent methyltransferase